MEVFERHRRNGVVAKEQYTQQTESHRNQCNAKEWIYLADKFIDRQECGNKVVDDDNRQPPILRQDIEFCREDIGRTYHKDHTHQQKQNDREDTHKGSCALAEVASNDFGDAQTLITHKDYTREVVVHSTHKDTSEGYPQECDRTIASTENGSENRTCAGNVEQLNEEGAPTRHRHIIDTVVEFCTWNFGFWVDVADFIEVLAV